MSLTIFREDRFRFFFSSPDESRLHVHVHHADGEAKLWLEPTIELAQPHHLYWPDLDEDLAVEPIRHPEMFPPVAKSDN